MLAYYPVSIVVRLCNVVLHYLAVYIVGIGVPFGDIILELSCNIYF